MTELSIHVDGKPVPYQRTRGAGNRRYTEPRYAAWKEKAGWMMRRAMGSTPPTTENVAVIVKVTGTGLHASFATVTELKRVKGIRGDLDNYLKAILDAANGIVFDDDRQVVKALVVFDDSE